MSLFAPLYPAMGAGGDAGMGDTSDAAFLLAGFFVDAAEDVGGCFRVVAGGDSHGGNGDGILATGGGDDG